MVVICGNNRLIARAAQIVLTCNPFSGATPAGNENWKLCAAAGASAANECASAAVAICGVAGAGAGGAGCRSATGLGLGAAAVGFVPQHGGSMLWAERIAAE